MTVGEAAQLSRNHAASALLEKQVLNISLREARVLRVGLGVEA